MVCRKASSNSGAVNAQRRIVVPNFNCHNVLKSEFSGFDEVSHDRLKPVTKQRQQVVDQPALGLSAGNRGLEDVSMTNLLDSPKSLLPR
jgi:hypothetical protein